jgi:hypothetical protein
MKAWHKMKFYYTFDRFLPQNIAECVDMWCDIWAFRFRGLSPEHAKSVGKIPNAAVWLGIEEMIDNKVKAFPVLEGEKVPLEPGLRPLKKWLLENRANGFSFSETALRLCSLRPTQTVIDAIKKEMFQTRNNVWLFPEQVAEMPVIERILGQAAAWAEEYDLFSMRALYERFGCEIPRLSYLEDFMAFFKVVAPEFDCIRGFWTSRADGFNELVRDLVAQVEVDIFNKSEVTQAFVFGMFPNLSRDEVCDFIQRYSSKLLATNIGDLPCWKHIDTLNLPDDFDARLADVIDNLENLGYALTVDYLTLALCLVYRYDIRVEADLGDEEIFKSVIAERSGRVWKRKALASVA